MLLYIRGKENGKLLVDSVLNGPFKYGTITIPRTPTTPAIVRDRTYDELTNAEKICEGCDIKATNIDIVKLLVEGSEISLHERESKMYDEFDMFTSVPGETIHDYYLRQRFSDPIALIAKTHNSSPSYTNQSHYHQQLSPFDQQYYSPPVTTVQGRQNQGYAGSGTRSNVTRVNRTGGTNTAGQAKVIRYYKCQEEGHMARQCTKSKRPRNSAWFKEKEMLAEALESRVVLDEEQMAFLADNDLDAFDSNCDEAPSASVVLMAKLSSYYSKTLSRVPTHDNYLDNHVIDHTMQEAQYYEQSVFNNDTDIDNDITSESNMISYEKYLNETKNRVVQDTSFSTQHESMIMSVIEEMQNQVAKCTKVIVDKNAMVADFENQIHSLKQQLNATVESHKTLLTTVDVLKMESKAKEDKYLDEIIELEKKKKDFNTLCVSKATLCRTGILVTHIKTRFLPPIQPEPVLKEIPRELPTINLVKDSFNKMRSYVSDFKNVVTVRTKVTGQNEGSWGFEHIQEAFDKDNKPFVKTLKEYFHMFDQGLHKDNTDMKELLISQDLVHTVVNSLAKILYYKSMEKSFLDEYSKCAELKAELSKKNNMVEKAVYDELSKQCARIENRCISLKIKVQQYKESFQNNQPQNKQDAPEFPAFFEINELKAQLQAKNNSIRKLKDHIATLKGKGVSEGAKSETASKVIALGMYKIYLEPLSPKLLRNREAYVDYLKHTQVDIDTLREILEQACNAPTQKGRSITNMV
ncbi:retrovirus-related pol polyprotein from transposon TNT 1-94 [Tanacetum coccineum]